MRERDECSERGKKGKTTRALEDPQSKKQKLLPRLLPCYSRSGRLAAKQTEYSWDLWKKKNKLPSRSKPSCPPSVPRGANAKERHGKVPIQPTRFQQLCRFVPHERAHSRSLPISGRLSHTRTPLGCAWRKVTTSTARGEGMETSFPQVPSERWCTANKP